MTLSVDGGKFKALAVYENLQQDLPRVILSTLSDFTHKTQRMAFILLFRAEITTTHSLMISKMIAKPRYRQMITVFSIYHHRPVRTSTNKSMRQEHTNMFLHIAECLRSKLASTTENVLSVS